MTKIDDKRVPALRFKGFNDDWAQQELKDLVSFYSGLTYHPEDIKSTGVFVIRSSNIKHGQLVNADNVYVDPKSVNSTYVRKKDIIVVVRNGSRNLIGKHAQVHNDISKSVIGAFMTGIRSNNNDFISALFDSDKFRKEIHKNLGATINQITTGEFKKMIFPTPQTLNEKEKIGNLISQINSLVSLQQRKEKILKQIQQAIYYNIYPEYGTKIPIIRHREFNKDWSIVSFNKLYKKSKEKNDLTYGEDKIISVAKMYFKHESQNSSKDYLKTYNVFKKGDIAFEGNRSEGFSHGRFVQNNIGDGIVSHVFDVFTPLKKENLNYWKYAIHNEHIMKYILVKSTTKATMMNNLSTKDFLKQKIAVPNSREMKKISHLLKRLDDQLEFSKRKIKLLTKVKQFLLQNMFI